MRRVMWLIPILLIGGVQAGERLNDAELKDFLEGHTVTGIHHKRGVSQTFHATDGTVQSKSEDGTERTGKWWVEDGKRCIRWNHETKDRCHYVERESDGSHALVHGSKGKRLVEIRSTAPGNQL